MIVRRRQDPGRELGANHVEPFLLRVAGEHHETDAVAVGLAPIELTRFEPDESLLVSLAKYGKGGDQ